MEPVFGGRDIELRTLELLLHRALENSVQFCFIAGYRGDGKTTLVEHFAEIAQAKYKKLSYAVGSCQQTTQEKSYEPFQEMFSQFAGIHARELHASFGSERAFDLKHKIQIATQTLVQITPDLIGVLIPGVSLLTKAVGTLSNQIITRRIEASKDTNIQVDHINEQCLRFFREFAEQGPLILVFDDVQWLDKPSYFLLRYIQENLRNLPIFVVITYRPNEISVEFQAWINEIKSDLGDVTIDLHLAPSELRSYEFTQSFLQQNSCNVSQDFVEVFTKRTEAKPVFAVEMLRYLRSSNVLIQNSFGMWVENPELEDWKLIPTHITRLEALIEGRISLLSRDFVEMLRVASVEGYEFTAQVIAQVIGSTERVVLEVLSDILEHQHGFIKEIGEESIGDTVISRFRFSNILYQEYIYDNIGLGVRRLWHNEIASTLESIYERDPNQIAVQLAFHYEKALKLPKAAEYLVVVGRQQLNSRQSEEAIKTLERALDLARSVDYVSGIVDALRYMGMEYVGNTDFERAEPLLQESLKLGRQYQRFAAVSYSLRGLGRIRSAQQKNSESMYFYMEGVNVAKQINNLELECACLSNIGVLVRNEGRFDDANFFFLQTLDIANRIDSDEERYYALLNLGSVARKTGHLEQAKDYLAKVLEVLTRRPDWDYECGLKIGRAYVALLERDLALACKLIIEVYEIAVPKQSRSRIVGGLLCSADIFAKTQYVQLAAKIIGYIDNSARLDSSNRVERDRIEEIIKGGLSESDLEYWGNLGKEVEMPTLIEETRITLSRLVD